MHHPPAPILRANHWQQVVRRLEYPRKHSKGLFRDQQVITEGRGRATSAADGSSVDKTLCVGNIRIYHVLPRQATYRNTRKHVWSQTDDGLPQFRSILGPVEGTVKVLRPVQYDTKYRIVEPWRIGTSSWYTTCRSYFGGTTLKINKCSIQITKYLWQTQGYMSIAPTTLIPQRTVL